MPNLSPKPAGQERNSALRLHDPQRAAVDSRETAAISSRWSRLFAWRWLIAAVTISLLLEAAVIYWFRVRTPDDAPMITGEVALGSFEFTRSGGDNQIYRGQFDLFVRLADRLDASQQQQFVREEQRLQQAVEETVRRLRLADFTELRLTRLKDRVQDRLNDELGFNGVEEVLIANFKIAACESIERPKKQSAATGGAGRLDASPPLSAE